MIWSQKKVMTVVTMCLTLLLTEGTAAIACSLWAATGDGLTDGSTLVGHTWDVSPGTEGELRLVIPQKGFRYLAVFPTKTKGDRHTTAGINEHGLTAVKATPDTAAPTGQLIGKADLIERILTSFATVDSVLTSRRLLAQSKPLFLVIADRSKIALVQIGSGGILASQATSKGLLCHTNHYTHQSLLKENKRYARESVARLNRLQHLLSHSPTPLTADHFLAIASDRANGPDTSIWLTGSGLNKKVTLASWVVSLPPKAPPELYFRLLNPRCPEVSYEIKLDKPFWFEGTE